MRIIKISEEISDKDRDSRNSLLGKSLKDSGYEYNKVSVYRAVPSGVTNFTRNDFVTLSKKFAIEHAESNKWYHMEDQQVISAILNSNDVHEHRNPGEYLYSGEDVNGKVIHIAKYEEL
jgi:hypothetical protein